MYIRKIKSRNSTCFQIGEKQSGCFILKTHVGCASTPERIAALRLKAKQLLHEKKYTNQLSLLKAGISPPSAKLVNWRITGYHKVFGAIYDLIGFPKTMLRDLVVARIAYPRSKAATLRYLARYLGINIPKNRLFRFLDTLDKDELTDIAFNFVSSCHSAGISICFYDVTTLYFETDFEDNLRQKGFSKDYRLDTPQIIIGLFVDNRGYPFDFDYFSGKTFEGHTFIKAMEAIRQKHDFANLTIVADAGMLSKDNLDYLNSVKINYIVGARLKNMPADITNDIINHSFQKLPLFERIVKDKRLIVGYLTNRAKKDAKNRERLIAKLKKKLLEGRTVIRKSKYLTIQGKHKVMGINDEQIAYDKRFDGLKGYYTNQDSKLSASDAIDQYHRLWQVEKAFRMAKGDLRERPIFHRRSNRIKAHLLLCFISLLVMKETERHLINIGFSLEQAIERLGKIGEGKVRIGAIELFTESENESLIELFHKELGNY